MKLDLMSSSFKIKNDKIILKFYVICVWFNKSSFELDLIANQTKIKYNFLHRLFLSIFSDYFVLKVL